MSQTQTTRTFTEMLEQAKGLDFTVPGSYFLSTAEIESIDRQQLEKISRVVYYGAGKIVGAFLSKHRDDSGIIVTWGQN